MKKIFKLSVLPLALLIGCEGVNAAKPGAYIGGGVGLSWIQEQVDVIRENDNVFAGHVFFGYNFNPYFGIETNYSTYDTMSYTDSDYPQISVNLAYNAVSFVGKIYAPSSSYERFNPYVALGIAQVFNKWDGIYNGRIVSTISDIAFVPTAGVGITYDLNQHFTMGMELSGFGEKESSDSLSIVSSGLATLNLAYTF